MKILICPDSFKGSLSADEVALAIKTAIENVSKNNSFTILPLADGGEGTKDVLVNALRGKTHKVMAKGPLFEDRTGEYGLLEKSIVLESASVLGLPFVPPDKRNPLNTSSYGLGLLIKDALSAGKEHIILTVGGVATNDCGTGMLSALGVKFYDKDHREIIPDGRKMGDIEYIDDREIFPKAKHVKWTILCDVDNCLCGKRGAAWTFGPQKGATPEICETLDRNARHFAETVKQKYGKDILLMKHGGAAGGLPAGLSVFFDTEIVGGTNYILKLLDFEEKAKKSDLIITGEGQTDSQTFRGKLISGIIRYAGNTPVMIISGSVTEEGYKLRNDKIKIFSVSENINPEESMAHPKKYLMKKTEEIFRNGL